MSRQPKPHGPLERRFLELLERNRGRIERLARAFSRTPADQEDLEGEVCFQLWRSLPEFDGRSEEDTWLYRVALNVCLLQGRRERGRRQGRRAYEAEPRPATAPAEAETRLDVRRRRERLVEEVRRLPPTDRALVTLFLEEVPYRRIAEITGLTESNVGVRLHRARRRLAERMTEAETPAGAEARHVHG